MNFLNLELTQFATSSQLLACSVERPRSSLQAGKEQLRSKLEPEKKGLRFDLREWKERDTIRSGTAKEG